jgi:low temperature requirement protein LtrA
MARSAQSSNLLRHRRPHEHAPVGFIELFFDLVFVFAVTQLSHRLIEHYSVRGAVETFLLFLAVWWAWIDTSWVTNWLDPQRRPVRVMLLVLMLAGLVLSTSIPEAFGERAIYFAGAYAFIQVGRSLFMMWALRLYDPVNYRNFQRITAWFTLFSALWIAGAFADGDLRLAIWALAVAVENVAPGIGFWTPGLGRSTTADWVVEGSHMAERCGLFIIIALGESILVTGATFAGLEWTWLNKLAFLVAFVGSVALWWIYFDSGQQRGSRTIAESTDPGRLARLAYTYFHIPIVAGIIVSAVADEFVLMHPTGHTGFGVAAAILYGPAAFLVGTALFKKATLGRWATGHLLGAAVLVLLTALADALSPISLGGCTAIVLVVVAVGEVIADRRSEAVP